MKHQKQMGWDLRYYHFDMKTNCFPCIFPHLQSTCNFVQNFYTALNDELLYLQLYCHEVPTNQTAAVIQKPQI